MRSVAFNLSILRLLWQVTNYSGCVWGQVAITGNAMNTMNTDLDNKTAGSECVFP